MSRTGLTIANSKKTHLHLTPKQRTFAEVYVATYPNITKKEAAKKTGPGKVKWSVTASGRRRKANGKKKA